MSHLIVYRRRRATGQLVGHRLVMLMACRLLLSDQTLQDVNRRRGVFGRRHTVDSAKYT